LPLIRVQAWRNVPRMGRPRFRFHSSAAKYLLQQWLYIFFNLYGLLCVGLDRPRHRDSPWFRVIRRHIQSRADVAAGSGKDRLAFFRQQPIDVDLGRIGVWRWVKQGEGAVDATDIQSLPWSYADREARWARRLTSRKIFLHQLVKHLISGLVFHHNPYFTGEFFAT